MATASDGPSRIDQIFADPRWVDEALTAAAADAREHHRNAGVPMVVSRDGRIEHIPADGLAPDPNALLKDLDFEVERSARGLVSWFEERRTTINACLMAKEPALLHEGRFKRFYEELYPFALWVGHVYGGRDDVTCVLNSAARADRDYDAMVKDGSTVTYVQLTTTTFDRVELRRMKKLLTDKLVSAYGPPEELEFFSHDEVLAAAFDKIDRAVLRKASHSFGRDYDLVVCFDDFMWFGTEEDRAAITRLVTGRLPSWRLNISALDIIGISGRTFLRFPVPER